MKKINSPGIYPKLCTDCQVELNPGKNCYMSMFKHKIYKCTSCKKKQSKGEHIKYQAIPSWRAKKAKYVAEYIEQDGAGVYCIYEKDEIIYIGESNRIKSRIISHFSKHLKKGELWQPPIPEALVKGILDRDDLSYDVLEAVDDTLKRKERETHYIKEFIATHGKAPKYNTYKTE